MQYGVYYKTERVTKEKIRRMMRKCVIVVVRHNLGKSKPCKHCLQEIQEYGIKKVYYSLGGHMIRENSNRMYTDFVTSGKRRNWN